MSLPKFPNPVISPEALAARCDWMSKDYQTFINCIKNNEVPTELLARIARLALENSDEYEISIIMKEVGDEIPFEYDILCLIDRKSRKTLQPLLARAKVDDMATLWKYIRTNRFRDVSLPTELPLNLKLADAKALAMEGTGRSIDNLIIFIRIDPSIGVSYASYFQSGDAAKIAFSYPKDGLILFDHGLPTGITFFFVLGLHLGLKQQEDVVEFFSKMPTKDIAVAVITLLYAMKQLAHPHSSPLAHISILALRKVNDREQEKILEALESSGKDEIVASWFRERRRLCKPVIQSMLRLGDFSIVDGLNAEELKPILHQVITDRNIMALHTILQRPEVRKANIMSASLFFSIVQRQSIEIIDTFASYGIDVVAPRARMPTMKFNVTSMMHNDLFTTETIKRAITMVPHDIDYSVKMLLNIIRVTLMITKAPSLDFIKALVDRRCNPNDAVRGNPDDAIGEIPREEIKCDIRCVTALEMAISRDLLPIVAYLLSKKVSVLHEDNPMLKSLFDAATPQMRALLTEHGFKK